MYVISVMFKMRSSPVLNAICPSKVFHAALIVMASLQVHETHTALVTEPGVNWTVDYVVRFRRLPVVCYRRSVFT